MALEKQISVDLIEVIENGAVQVRTNTRILEDGQIISSSLHRFVINPGDDYSQQDEKVKAICGVIQTPQIIEAYKAAVAAREN
jgi:hypothetical protein